MKRQDFATFDLINAFLFSVSNIKILTDHAGNWEQRRQGHSICDTSIN